MIPYALHIASGSTGAFHDVLSPTFANFLPGLPLYFSFDYAATRATGTDAATLHVELRWYDAAGTALTPWTSDVILNATVGDTLQKFTVIPPAGAVSGKCYIKVTPAASPMQHDVWIKKLRLGKTEISATNGANWASNVSSRPSNLAALSGSEGVNNGLVSIGANGSLLGGGGGQVTIGGIAPLLDPAATMGTALNPNSEFTAALVGGLPTAWSGNFDPSPGTLQLTTSGGARRGGQAVRLTGGNWHTITPLIGVTTLETIYFNIGVRTITNGTSGNALWWLRVNYFNAFGGNLGNEDLIRQNVSAAEGYKDLATSFVVPATFSGQTVAAISIELIFQYSAGATNGVGDFDYMVVSRVAPGATNSDLGNLALGGSTIVTVNPDLTMPAADGRPVGWYGCYYVSNAASVKFSDRTRTASRIETVNGNASAAFRVEPNVQYELVLRVAAASAAGANCLYAVSERDADMPVGSKYIYFDDGGNASNPASFVPEAGYAAPTRTAISGSSNPASTAWVDIVVPYTASSTAKWASLFLLNWGGADALIVDRAYLRLKNTGGSWGTNITGRPGNLAALSGSEGVNNSLLAIGSNGALFGGGGGQVTIGGLGGGPWATFSSLQPGNLVVQTTNLFPYPRGAGTTDGRSPVQLGWGNTTFGSGWSELYGGHTDWTGGGYYQAARPGASSGAFELFPFYDLPWDSGGGFPIAASVSGYATNGTFAPYVDFLNAAKATLDRFYLTYNAASDRYEGSGTTPTGTAYLRFVGHGTYAASAGNADLTFWAIKVERNTYATRYTDPPDMLSRPGNFRRLGDQRNMPAIAVANISSNFSGSITYSASPGTPATATISVSAGTLLMGNVSLLLNAMSIGVTGTQGSTQAYQLYIVNPNYDEGSFTLIATTNPNDVISADGRMWIGGVVVGFPSAGSPPATGGGVTGGGGRNFDDVNA